MPRDAKIVFAAVFMLVMVGVVMIYSSSAVYADGRYGDSLYFVKRHLIYLVLGCVAAAFCMAVPAKAVRDNARKIMLAAVILLVAVLIPGIGSLAGGARRWIRFAGVGFQPSEVCKLALIIYLADLTARKGFVMRDLRYGFLPVISVIGVTAALVLLEPDMGTAVAVCFIGLSILFVAGARLKHLGVISLGTLPVMALAVLCKPYRVKRILAFFNPWDDSMGSGFQLIQSFIALGSGGFTGLGLGASKQKLFYLPESHTDFIFSIIGEELGFIGAAFVLGLFAVLVWFCFRISFKLKDLFMSRVVLGISIMLVFEVIVNIGVSTGALPTKGLPLPFISYGGSSLVCHFAAIGLLFNLSGEEE